MLAVIIIIIIFVIVVQNNLPYYDEFFHSLYLQLCRTDLHNTLVL